MADVDATFSAVAAGPGLEPVPALGLGALTPLLIESKHCQVSRPRAAASPALVDYLATKPSADFSFELAYGILLGSLVW